MPGSSYPAEMGSSRWRVAATAAMAVACLVGCTPEGDPAPSDPPSESAEPTYSDEELLEQARETYEGYLAAFAEMVAADEVDYTVLTPYATEEVATNDAAQEMDLREGGVTTVGTMTLLSMDFENAGSDEVASFACLDTTTATFVDDDGNDVTPPSRPDQIALALQFTVSSNGSLLLASQDPPTEAQMASCGL